MRYVILENAPGDYAARLGDIQGLEDDYELVRGISVAARFPSDVGFRMDDDFPDCLQLEDLLDNDRGALLVSSRLSRYLESQELKNNEILPVTVLNHRGRKVQDDYFIVHQVGLQDCIDLEASETKANPIDPELLMAVERLVLDEARVDPGVRLFRMAHYPFALVFERGLAEGVAAEGFSGLAFVEVDDWQAL